MSSYSGAKNAALWLTDGIVEEEDHVFAVNLHPGVIDTEMNSKNKGVPEDNSEIALAFFYSQSQFVSEGF